VSEENLDLVRRSTQAFNDRDLDALELTFCDDVVMRLPGGGFADLQGTEFRGRDAYLIWFKEMIYTLDVRSTIEVIRAVGDRVVVVSTALGSGATSGVPSTLRFGTVYSFRGGRISTVDHYYSPEDALRAVGLEE
jgi:ketosteroid isomerase-like protein